MGWIIDRRDRSSLPNECLNRTRNHAVGRRDAHVIMRFLSYPNCSVAVCKCRKQAQPVVAPDAEKHGAGELSVRQIFEDVHHD